MDAMKAVRETYGEIARRGGGCCGEDSITRSHAEVLGYTAEDLAAAPEGADLGLGCGNPIALAGLQPGEVVLDLGSGAGFDCFLAATAVGPQGRVVGVDVTPEMVAKARENAVKGEYANVEFHVGEIEHLPIADASADVVISNCVINLVPDKSAAFAEAFRVLKPGGRMHVSDIVLSAEAPEALRRSVAAYVSCIGGAITKEAYLDAIAQAGFVSVTVNSERDATDLLNSACCSAEEAACCDGPSSCCADSGDCERTTLTLPRGLALSVSVTAHKPT